MTVADPTAVRMEALRGAVETHCLADVGSEMDKVKMVLATARRYEHFIYEGKDLEEYAYG